MFLLILILMILLLPIFNSKENFIYYRIPFKTITKQKKIFFLKDKIPKIVFQSYKTRELPDSYRSTHKNMIDKNRDYTYYYYNDADCEKFLKSYNKSAYITYKILKKSDIKYIKGAGCSDLFRYCLLEKYGGIWLDMGMELLKPLDSIFNNLITNDGNQFISCLAANKISVFQAIICCTKNHPFLKEIISRICKNVILYNLQKNTHVWRLTGPILLANIITNNNIANIKPGENNINGKKFYLFTETIVNNYTGLYNYYVKNKDTNELVICSRCAHQKNGEIITKK